MNTVNKYLNYLWSLFDRPTTNLKDRADDHNINHNVSTIVKKDMRFFNIEKTPEGYKMNRPPDETDANILLEDTNYHTYSQGRKEKQ